MSASGFYLAGPMTTETIPTVRVDDREILLLGTAHVSAESVLQVEAAIREAAPDCVCVELDEKRLQALSDPDAWKKLDLFTVIRQGQFSTLIANILLSSHQKRMGLQTGVRPGSELYKAVTTARELGIPVVLVDREIKTTLRRVWSLTPWWRRLKLSAGLLESVFETDKVTEEDLGKLREQDNLSSMMDEMGKEFPEVRQVMLDERDHFMVGRIRQAPGKRVLAVIGAGHRQGMTRLLETGEATQSEEVIGVVPASSKVWTWLGWGIPAVILAALAWIGIDQGAAKMGQSALFWALSTAIPAALGTLLAFGHPLTILSAFLSAPITTLVPVLGVGHVTALVQTWRVPPRVEEMENVTDDISHFRKWWTNRLLRIVLCFLLPGLPTTIGMAFGGWHIFKNI